MTQRLVLLAALAGFTVLAGCMQTDAGDDAGMISAATAESDNDRDRDRDREDGAEDVPVTGVYKGGLRHERTTTIGKV
ncbi:MAG: hypothetical protein AAFU41_07630 [Pseudomonadota bacterium]